MDLANPNPNPNLLLSDHPQDQPISWIKQDLTDQHRSNVPHRPAFNRTPSPSMRSWGKYSYTLQPRHLDLHNTILRLWLYIAQHQ